MDYQCCTLTKNKLTPFKIIYLGSVKREIYSKYISFMKVQLLKIYYFVFNYYFDIL